MDQEPVEKLRDFKELDVAEKTRAVLGAVMEPVSREMVFEFAGIDYSALDPESQGRVDDVFNNVNTTEGGRYILNDEGRKVLENEVDMKSVHGAIAQVLLAWWEEKKD